MIAVLNSTKDVVDHSKFVSISKEAIDQLVTTVEAKDLEITDLKWTHYQWDYSTFLKILFIFDAVNFCYWALMGEPKWAIEINGEKFDGSVALLRCIEEEVRKSPDFLEAHSLANLTETEWARIVAGSIKIPLIGERLECLHELGKVLLTDFDGSYEKVITSSGNNAVQLTALLITKFPKFNDLSIYRGKEVGFYKRAQLLVKGIDDALAAYHLGRLTEMEILTAFADYKIPQILRKLAILNYHQKLADKIDGYQLIASGSEEEVEIRANTVWAVEAVRKALEPKFGKVTAAQVDLMLWSRSQEKTKDEKPYHRTVTTAY